jgi:hypothetical protein
MGGSRSGYPYAVFTADEIYYDQPKHESLSPISIAIVPVGYTSGIAKRGDGRSLLANLWGDCLIPLPTRVCSFFILPERTCRSMRGCSHLGRLCMVEYHCPVARESSWLRIPPNRSSNTTWTTEVRSAVGSNSMLRESRTASFWCFNLI